MKTKLDYDKVAFGLFVEHFKRDDQNNDSFVNCSPYLSLIILRDGTYKSKIIIDSRAGFIELAVFNVRNGTEDHVFKVDMAQPNAITLLLEECSKYAVL